MAAEKKQEMTIAIPAVRREVFETWLIGDSPLIVKAWDRTSREEMLRKHMGQPTQKKKAKDPERLVEEAFYIDNGRYVFISRAIKKAAVAACRFVDAKMTEARGMFFVLDEYVPIHGTDPVAREDMVRNSGMVADIRYRPMFEEWAVPIRIEFNRSFVKPDQILNLFENAGFGVGIGEWRPEKSGPFGRFHVARGGEEKRFAKMIPKVGPMKIEGLPKVDAA
jgi:hypothetical protein